GDYCVEPIRLLRDVVDRLGAADDDAAAAAEAGRHDDMGGVERLRADRPRLEIFRLDVAPDDRLPVAAAHDGVAVDDDAGDRLAALGGDGDGLADAQRRGRIGYRKVQYRRLLLQGPAPTLEREFHRDIATTHGSRVFEGGWIVVAIVVGFDPQGARIHDLEQHVLGLHHLPRHDA